MIIDKDGYPVMGIIDEDGIVIHSDDYAIALFYNKEQKETYLEMKALQRQLSATDYKAVKYSEGLYTEEEYASIKAERQALRDRWNELNDSFVPPSLSDAEISAAIIAYRLRKEGGVIYG